MYRVKFNKATAPARLCSAKQLAYTSAPKVQLSVGTRVIAVFHNSEDDAEHPKQDSKDHYYAGIIAEQLKTINNHRCVKCPAVKNSLSKIILVPWIS
jgi:hypothetical protein